MKTTFEMDGLLIQKDINDRNTVMAQCAACFEYSKWDKEHNEFACTYCKNPKYVINSGISLRTYNPLVHNKKKKLKK